MKLQTRRLILRQPRMKDAKDLIDNINNLNVSKYLLVVPYPYTVKDARWWINHCKEKERERPRTSYGFNIELKSERRIIGGIGISKIDARQGTADIGYWIGEDYWRKGIVTEAATRLIDFGFKKLKLRRIQAAIFVENEASQGLARSLGFQYEGRLRKACKAKSTGKIHDEFIYALLRKDWMRKR